MNWNELWQATLQEVAVLSAPLRSWLSWKGVGQSVLGQLLALATFFAFPAVRYVLLRRLARNAGQAEPWYLPAYGFRLVMRNLPRKHTLSKIEYRALLRTVIPASDGASVATFQDDALVERKDFFLFPGTDQVLLSFKLELTAADTLSFSHTDKLGKVNRVFEIDGKAVLIADFSAHVQNRFNFDISVARRVEVRGSRLIEIARAVGADNTEQSFEVSRIREVG